MKQRLYVHGAGRGGLYFFYFLSVRNMLFLFQLGHLFVFGNIKFSLVKWRKEGHCLFAFQQGTATSPKAQISPVLLHRHLPLQYSCRKNWIRYFFLCIDPKGFYTGGIFSAVCVTWMQHLWKIHRLSYSISLGKHGLLPFLLLSVLLFSFLSPALTSVANTFKFRCPQVSIHAVLKPQQTSSCCGVCFI